ncbi:MAG: hypothetical protein IPM35_39500 [Myxococcales bacterium]|nr:hypothetical protein [Myxococcales bacterium]
MSLDIPVGVVTDMRLWFGAGPPDGAAWQPVQSQVALRLPDQDATLVQVQARDLAGNLSQPLGIIITRPLVTPIDKAIALEELAEDRIEANDLSGARAAILTSLDFVKAGMSRAAKAVKSEPHPDRVHVLTTFAQILAFKQVARALLKPQTEAAGVEALRQALELEIALAAFADARRIEL